MQLRGGRIATPRSTPQDVSGASLTNPFAYYDEDVESRSSEPASTLTDPLDREPVIVPEATSNSANRESESGSGTGGDSTSGGAETSVSAVTTSACATEENETAMAGVPPPIGPQMAPFVPVLGEPRFPRSPGRGW